MKSICKRIFLLLILFATLISSAKAQSFIKANDILINGYAQKVDGTDFEYFSCIPGLRESMLVRASSGTDAMTWQTDIVPDGKEGQTAAFIWVAALGSGPGVGSMHLAVNGKNQFTFYTDCRPQWEINSADGSSLSFHSIMVDQYGDHHGYMVMRFPLKKLKKGQSLEIKVTGGNSNLTSWYMTFKKEIRTTVEMNAFPAVLRRQGKAEQLVEASVFFFGDNVEAQIFANGKQLANQVLTFGYNSINLGLTPVEKPTRVRLKVVAGNFNSSNTVLLQPVRKWTMYLVQHSHTDIGYTRSQTEILAEHLRYIDYALDYCDLTDDYPDDAKFRWTCEASWAVDEYLKSRPESQIKRLKQRISEGRIEVTGMYFNFDEIPDEQILAESLQALGRIRKAGIEVTTAMQDDVNGIGWCLNDYYNTAGVKYLNMGTHGHRALICFDVPTLFWWESPSGQRMLAFRAEHYMTGNTVFELQTGDFSKIKKNILNYLLNLESKKYPFNTIAIQHSGYLTDNSPPGTSASDLIKIWNQTFEWPKLSTATVSTFMKEMESKYSDDFQTIKGAWPDWWTDGFGASAREVAVSRNASVTLSANTAGLSMAVVAGEKLPADIQTQIEQAYNALLFYTEHTTGYSESVREPYSKPTMDQRALKESYAWEANRRVAGIGEQTMGLLQAQFERSSEPSLLIFNTLNWKRSAIATVYIDHQVVPRGAMAGIFDAEGNRLPAQPIESRSDGTYWAVWLNDVPAFGYKKYTIKSVDLPTPIQEKTNEQIFENQWYKIRFDLSKGVIESISDKQLNTELIDSRSGYRMGEFILEQLGNRSQMESRKLDDYKRKGLDTIWFDSMLKGQIWTSYRFYGETETAISPRGLMVEMRIFNTEKRIDLVYSIVKKSIIEPESFYIAFPFAVENGKHYTEVPGGVIETGVDQIPGSSCDWYTIQNFSSVRNTQMQIVFGSPEMPLAQFGNINTGRYQAGATPQSTHAFSWPMNNYWVTNFNADQRGGHTWSYYLTSSDNTGNGFANRFGTGCRTPLLSRVLPGGGTAITAGEGQYISGWPVNVTVISIKPLQNQKDLLLHVRETEGKDTGITLYNNLSGKQLWIENADVNGNILNSAKTVAKPWASAFYVIHLQD